MPAMGPKSQPTPTPTPAPSTPHDGAWTLDPTSHQWQWTPHATPDPGLVKDWGTPALTDIRQDPNGVLNHGAWTSVHGGGWQWTWGADPNPNLVKTYGKGALTNPDQTPNGAGARGKNTPPPPDVNPPTLTDKWNGVPPDVTGSVPPSVDDPHANGQTATEPPPHRAFVVSPGSIRNTETVLTGEIDTQIANYDSLKSYVEMSHGQNLYSSNSRADGLNNGPGYADLVTPQDRLLLAVGDVITLAGEFNQMLNMAAQNYAKADIDSFLPGG